MAVYTTVDPEMLDEFLVDYEIGSSTYLEGILQGVENSNYELQTTTGHYVLTVFERRAAVADLPYYLGLMAHLAEKDFPAPRPIIRKDSALFGQMTDKPAAIVTFLPGAWPQSPSVLDAKAAGASLANLHQTAKDYGAVRENTLGMPHWRALFERSVAQADTITPGLGSEISVALEQLERAWPTNLPTGHIHADLFPDNLFLKDGAVSGVIDFYFACTDAFAYDLAIMLNAWCFDPATGWSDAHATALQRGYESIRPLSAVEKAALPTLLEGAAMRFLLTRLFDWLNPAPDALVRPKDPLEQLACLRLHRSRNP
ncbi:MAG: homoserine kinase [Alphaproteobacteria bacterium]